MVSTSGHIPVMTEDIIRGRIVIFSKLRNISPGNPETYKQIGIRNTLWYSITLV
jgi:hypothetical protein